MLTDYIQILLVEDDDEDADLLKEYLEEANSIHYGLIHVRTLGAGLEKLTHSTIRDTIDIVLLDLSLPDNYGIDTVQGIRSAALNVPLVVLTGLDNKEIAIESLRQGAQDYINKNDLHAKLIERTIQYAIERGRLLKQLSVSEERYTVAIKGTNDALWDWNLSTDEIYFSPRWAEMLGCKVNQVGNRPDEWFHRIHPNDRNTMMVSIDEHLSDKQSYLQNEHQVEREDGTFFWVLCRATVIRDEHHCPCRLAGSLTDITERKLLEQKLFEEKELALVTLNSIGDAVITTDALGNIDSLNPAAETLTGWTFAEIQGKPIQHVFELVDGETLEAIPNPVDIVLREDRVVRLSNHPMLVTRDRQQVAIDDSAAPIHSTDGTIVGSVVIFHDVTEERGRAQQLAWQANHDPLTGLLNRYAFQTKLDKAIECAKLSRQTHVLCYVDLDYFKVVNDTCGHAAGDNLLEQISKLIQSHVRKTDSVARLGGDEFGILLENCPFQRAVQLSNLICESINEFRFVWQEHVFKIGSSVGIYVVNHQTYDADQAVNAADAACYVAKQRGRGRSHVYQDDDHTLSQHNIETQWFNRLTAALEHDQFELFYQPICPSEHPEVNKTDINENYYEVLLRLKGTDGHLIAPGAFLPAAERYNLMPAIDRWVIQRFFRYLSTANEGWISPATPLTNSLLPATSSLDASLPGASFYAINLSGASLNDDTFISFVREQFETYNISPRKICFEITETVAIANLSRATELITDLRQLGCQFALDDFGTGMSSLAYLKALPIDYLKIDGNFIRGITQDQFSQAVVRAVNNIGHLIGLKTVAEFVSTPAILETVKTLGIDFVQGHGIATPAPLPSRAE